MKFELYNTTTEQIEAAPQEMTEGEAQKRNSALRYLGEPQRWLKVEESHEELEGE